MTQRYSSELREQDNPFGIEELDPLNLVEDIESPDQCGGCGGAGD